ALLRKELAIGTLNGVLWATVVGIVAIVWFDRESIGFVAAAAVLLNLAVGALAGVIVPVVLRRLDVDPALAGGMVLTTVTDVVGFVSLLGLGTIILL
ncbi:MAG: magnesium transporter, partial [Pseudomonadota bacterium]